MSFNFNKITHRNVYVFTLTLLAISLPLSPFITSVCQFVLGLNWLIERNFREKFQRLKNSKGLWLISSIYFVHVLGLIYTTNFEYAFHDLKIKLPILILPIIIGSVPPLEKKHLDKLLKLFVWAVFSATLISFGIYLGIGNYNVSDVRGASVIISHIRFSLYIVLSIVFTVYFLFSKEIAKPKYVIIYLSLIIWFCFKLILFQSLTGTVVLYFILAYFTLLAFKESFNKVLKTSSLTIVLLFTITSIAFVSYALYKFYNIPDISKIELETYTKQGNKYSHYTSERGLENGNYIWLYVCDKELREEWNKRSNLNYDSLDNRGQIIRYTIVRYLASKGLRKDSDGISALTGTDVKNIENGCANYLYAEDLNFYARVYQTIWEIDNYIRGGDPSQHSVTQRIEFLKAGLYIAKQNLLLGIGTGDVPDEYRKVYKTIDTPIEYALWKRAHNQYVSFILTFGLIGFAWIIFAFIYPILKRKEELHFLLVSYIIAFFLSMINEDTLETQAGATFFAYFFTFLLCHNHLFVKLRFQK